MLVSWNWLKDYVALDMSPAEVSHRLMMAGLNHESTESHGDDFAVDLEITSNRPDCLGHLGIAREISVLWNRDLCIPAANPQTSSTAVADLAAVRVDAPSLCPRYAARVIRGCKVGPNPEWLANRLRTIGIAVINIYPPVVLFAVFVVYGLSGYGVYGWRKARGEQLTGDQEWAGRMEQRGGASGGNWFHQTVAGTDCCGLL